MELRHLKYFVAVAEELHFGRAAKKLHIAQPPLSQQIKNLEDELGVKLFDRTRRAIQMTDAGIYFLKEAQQVLLHVEQAAETARRIYRGQAGRLIVGFVGSVIHTFLPEGLRLFRERFPDVELVLQELNTAEQIKALHARRIDVGFLLSGCSGFPACVSNAHASAFDGCIAQKTRSFGPQIAPYQGAGPGAFHSEYTIIRAGCSRCLYQPVPFCRVQPENSAGGRSCTNSFRSRGFRTGSLSSSGFYKKYQTAGCAVYTPCQDRLLLVKLAVVWRSDNSSTLVKSFVKVIESFSHLRR